MADLMTHIRHFLSARSETDGGLTDEELLARFVRQRDQAAFELLVYRHGPMVLGVCRRLLRREQDVEDAFQAAFLILVNKAGSITRYGSVSSWLYKVAYRVALRARTATSKRNVREATNLDDVAAPAVGHSAGCESHPPIDELIASLSEKYRLPVIMCYLEGKTHREAAKQLGCAEGTVACRLSRARQMLRKRLNQKDFAMFVGLPGLMTPDLPRRLVQLSVSVAAATRSAAGDVVGATALAEGVMRTMFWTKLKIACVGLAILAVASSGALIVINRAIAGKSDDVEWAATAQASTVAEPGMMSDPFAPLKQRMQSLNNLRQIGVAMHMYSDFSKRLPPPAIYSKDGKPLLSWRVLILPFLEREELYKERQDLFKEFNLEEPWDGPSNKKLLARMPAVYAAPGRKPENPLSTYYQVFVGKGAAFEENQRMRLPESFPDGTSRTLAVVEARSSVPWTKPQDLPYAADRPLPALGGIFDGVFNAVLFDGSTKIFRKDTDPSLLRAAITRNGGEALDIDKLAADLRTGVKVLPADIEQANRDLARRWELARAELDKLTPPRLPPTVLDKPDARTALLLREHSCLMELLEATRAQIEAAKATNKE
jgi:RNA polymerase sigma factor (sigma-70 family)